MEQVTAKGGVLALLLLFATLVHSNEYQHLPVDQYVSDLTEYSMLLDEYMKSQNDYVQETDEAPPPPKWSLIVNKSTYEVQVFKDVEVVGTHRAIIGRPGRETPTTSATLSSVILNPTWEVPRDLNRAFVNLVNQHNDPYKYLEEHQFFVLVDNEEVDVRDIKWTSLSSNDLNQLTIKQHPGPKNFIGQVLFTLEETGTVQMHDTPDKHLFDRNVREFSAGCIRVDEAVTLAASLLDLDEERVNDMVKDNITFVFKLPDPIEVEIVE